MTNGDDEEESAEEEEEKEEESDEEEEEEEDRAWEGWKARRGGPIQVQAIRGGAAVLNDSMHRTPFT